MLSVVIRKLYCVHDLLPGIHSHGIRSKADGITFYLGSTIIAAYHSLFFALFQSFFPYCLAAEAVIQLSRNFINQGCIKFLCTVLYAHACKFSAYIRIIFKYINIYRQAKVNDHGVFFDQFRRKVVDDLMGILIQIFVDRRIYLVTGLIQDRSLFYGILIFVIFRLIYWRINRRRPHIRIGSGHFVRHSNQIVLIFCNRIIYFTILLNRYFNRIRPCTTAIVIILPYLLDRMFAVYITRILCLGSGSFRL